MQALFEHLFPCRLMFVNVYVRVLYGKKDGPHDVPRLPLTMALPKLAPLELHGLHAHTHTHLSSAPKAHLPSNTHTHTHTPSSNVLALGNKTA